MNAKISNIDDESISPRIGEGKSVMNRKTVLKLDGLKITPASVTDGSVEATDPHAASRHT